MSILYKNVRFVLFRKNSIWMIWGVSVWNPRLLFVTQTWHYCTILTSRGFKIFQQKQSCQQWELNNELEVWCSSNSTKLSFFASLRLSEAYEVISGGSWIFQRRGYQLQRWKLKMKNWKNMDPEPLSFTNGHALCNSSSKSEVGGRVE